MAGKQLAVGGGAIVSRQQQIVKREFIQRAKKLPYLVGLELVACQVFGGVIGDESARHIFLSPFNSDQTDNAAKVPDLDSDPTVTEEQACSLNNGNADQSNVTVPALVFETMDSGCEALDLSVGILQPPPSPHPVEMSRDHVMTSADDAHLCVPVPQHDTALGKRKGTQVKRSYTEEMLAAAVSDVKAGKLGTRRAAAIYGVPRSTLRNKVFRNNPNRRPPPAAAAAAAAAAGGVTGGQSVSGLSKRAADEPPRPLTSWELKLAEVRRKHDLQAGFSRPFGMPPLFYNNECLLECERAFSLSDPYTYDTKVPVLRQLVAKVTRQMLDHRQQQQHQLSTSAGVNSGDSCENVSRTTAEFNNNSNNCHKKKSESLSGKLKLISSNKILSQQLTMTVGNQTKLNLPKQVNTRGLPNIVVEPAVNILKLRKEATKSNIRSTTPSSTSDTLANTTTTLTSNSSNANDYVMMTSPEVTRRDKRSALASPPSSSKSSSKSSKRSVRPKRGQYRRYKMELLMEAVRAVQQGEMSVHRAGSYYGVPHSTLEYKVKERHLLRQKKLAAAKSLSDNAAVAASSTRVASGEAEQTEQKRNCAKSAKKQKLNSSTYSTTGSNDTNSNNSVSGYTSTCDEFDESNTQLSGASPQSAHDSSSLLDDPEDQIDDQKENKSIISMDKVIGSSLMEMAFSGNSLISFPPPLPPHPHSAAVAASPFLANFGCFPWSSPFMAMSLPPASFYPPPPSDAGRGMFMNGPPPLHGMFASELLKSLQFKANSLGMTSLGSSNAD